MSEPVNQVINDISNKYNPATPAEGLAIVAKAIQTNDPNLILNPIKNGAEEFEKRMGRPMTYSEMRSMFG